MGKKRQRKKLPAGYKKIKEPGFWAQLLKVLLFMAGLAVLHYILDWLQKRLFFPQDGWAFYSTVNVLPAFLIVFLVMLGWWMGRSRRGKAILLSTYAAVAAISVLSLLTYQYLDKDGIHVNRFWSGEKLTPWSSVSQVAFEPRMSGGKSNHLQIRSTFFSKEAEAFTLIWVDKREISTAKKKIQAQKIPVTVRPMDLAEARAINRYKEDNRNAVLELLDLKDPAPSAGRPIIGSPAAKVEIAQACAVTDNECLKLHDEIYEAFKDSVMNNELRFRFIHYPVLEDSETAAYAGEAIFRQNPPSFQKYFREIASRRGASWSSANLATLIQTHLPGIDADRVMRELNTVSVYNAVSRDHNEALLMGAEETPAFFVNGRKLPDVTADKSKEEMSKEIKAMINEALGKSPF
ncbi:DsbA family protein [Paenibacillus lutrae]|nr:thioredoxin domain-containing protein [Paenibacillus lutrae]